MNKTVYRKVSFNLTLAVILSAVINRLFLKGPFYFSFLLVFFAVANLLGAWICYLRMDGFNMLHKTQGFWFKVRNIKDNEDDEYVHLDIEPEKYHKLTILGYLASGIILMFFSFITYKL